MEDVPEWFAKTFERHFVDGGLSDEEFSDRRDWVLPRARTPDALYALGAALPDPAPVDTPRRSLGQKRPVWRFGRT